MLGRSGCACSSSLLAMFRQEFELSLLPGHTHVFNFYFVSSFLLLNYQIKLICAA